MSEEPTPRMLPAGMLIELSVYLRPGGYPESTFRGRVSSARLISDPSAMLVLEGEWEESPGESCYIVINAPRVSG
jgi:hypothetical protein